MKIDDSIKTGTAVSGTDGPVRVSKAGPRMEGIAAPGTSGESVQLSTQLQDIERNFTNGEVFNAARVEEIKRAISEGQFVVNPDKVADSLLETVRDLIQTQRI